MAPERFESPMMELECVADVEKQGRSQGVTIDASIHLSTAYPNDVVIIYMLLNQPHDHDRLNFMVLLLLLSPLHAVGVGTVTMPPTRKR
jgi:hypothetical protein